MPQEACLGRIRQAATTAARRRRILAVDIGALPAHGFAIAGDLVVHVRLAHLAARLLVDLAPDMVIAPLIARDGDVIDLGDRLAGAGYRGPVIVVSRPLPRAELVLREVGALYPGLALALVETDD